MDDLDWLTDSLSETSAAILRLVPQLLVHSGKIEVSLHNSGTSNIGMVKLGVSLNEAPEGSRCDPSDPMLFHSLLKGQSVQAEFKVTGAEGAMKYAAADISYFIGGAAAHLRLHLW